MANRKRTVAFATTALIGLAVTIAILAANGISLPCLFNKVTGLLCPGCGNTRAAVAILKLDFKAAFAYNPMFLPEMAYLVWVYASCCRSFIAGNGFRYRSRPSALDIAVLFAVAAWGIVRNII